MRIIAYEKLVKIFTREKRSYYEDRENNFIIIHSKILHRGGQRIKVNQSGISYVINR
ncbi:MAG TPA: hypothetical protein VMV77_14845 [Bacteroidales bacterium]|nr:hypothetical protein [Bacteroidales bacterium]